MNKETITQIMLVPILVISIVLLVVIYEASEEKIETKELKTEIESSSLVMKSNEEWERINSLISACVQSSNDMNASYNLLKKQYEELSVKYYSSDDDYLEKENEILRKEIELYKQSERE